MRTLLILPEEGRVLYQVLAAVVYLSAAGVVTGRLLWFPACI